MANEVLKRDGNRRNVMGGVTNDANLEIVQLRVDPVTKRLLVDASVTADGVSDGDVVDGGDIGFFILGSDGTNYQTIVTDSDGHLQVDILSGGTGGVQYTEGDTDATITGTAMLMEAGSNTLVPVQGNTTDGILVNLGSNNDVVVTNAGTFAVQVDGSALTALQNIDTDLTTVIGHVDGIETLIGTTNTTLTTIDGRVDGIESLLTTIDGRVDGIEGLLTTIDADTGNIDTKLGVIDDWDNGASDGASVSGDVAHDSVDAGEPVKIGHKAIAHGTNPTAVAAGDRTDSYANRAGVPFMIGGHPNIQTVQLNVTDADGAQSNVALITVATGLKIVVTHITVTADHANTGDVQVRIGFGTANTPSNDAAKVILSHPGIAPGSGVSLGNGGGMIGVGADGEDLRITCEDPAGGALDIVVGYYTIES